MGFTKQDIDSFHQFAAARLSNGGAVSTLEECLQLWRAEREFAETVAAVRRGEGDIEAGRHNTLGEVDEEIHSRFSKFSQN